MKQQELHPYKHNFFSKISLSIRIPIIKWWFAGAIYYLIGWGLPQLKGSGIDTYVTMGLVIGLVNVTIIRFIIKEISPSTLIANKYISIRNKTVIRIPINVLYGMVISVLIAGTYDVSNRLINHLFDLGKDRIIIGTEPILYGILFIVFDSIWITIRNLAFKPTMDDESTE